MERKLYTSKEKCCGCGTCVVSCPVAAISMQLDEYGFRFPKVDAERCIGCGKCERVCGYQNGNIKYNVKAVYAAITKNTDVMQSTSGGVFASLAKSIIEDNGYVFGAAYYNDGLKLNPIHIEANTLQELKAILGSKYVQTSSEHTFERIKELLVKGEYVLFSGTPCQVDGLNHYLGKDYGNLLTVDIICHGVPSAAFFWDYCSLVEKTCRIKIENVIFRDKRRGWNLIGVIEGKTKNKLKVIPMRVRMSSYYNMFLAGSIYRESCYSCKYACSNRPGDISIGDYWGIEDEQPNLLIENGGVFDNKKGVSCLMINTSKGRRYLDRYKENLIIADSSFEFISRRNGQLLHPSEKNIDRDEIMEAYKNGGYVAVEKWFIRKQGIKYYLRLLKFLLRG